MTDDRDICYPLKNRLIGIPPRIIWNGSGGDNHDGIVNDYHILDYPYIKTDKGWSYG